MSCKKCKSKESYTCGKKLNARCIDYEGELHENTNIEECEEPDIEDVIEDINEELNFLHSQTDLTNLGSCEGIEYPSSTEDMTIPEALKAHEDILCELISHTGYGEPEPCPDCNSSCDDNDGGCPDAECCEALIYVTQLPIQLDITTTVGYPLLEGSAIFISPGSPTKLTEVDLNIVEAGDYIVKADFTLEYGYPPTSGGSWVNTLYELRIGNTVVPYSTRHVKVDTGTPADAVNTFTVTSEATGVAANSVLSLWINADTTGLTDTDVLILSCTLTATKKR